MRPDCPPPHATHRTGLFEQAFAQASATIALVQVRNGLKLLQHDRPPIPVAAVVQNIEANLQIIERALGVSDSGSGRIDRVFP